MYVRNLVSVVTANRCAIGQTSHHHLIDEYGDGAVGWEASSVVVYADLPGDPMPDRLPHGSEVIRTPGFARRGSCGPVTLR